MGAATYIGRVGGLAVALGVGTAIATGYGVASADDTTSNPPPSDTTSGSTDTTTNTTTTTTNTQTSTEPSNTPVITDPDNDTTPSSTTTNTVTGGTVVSAQTNTGTLGTTGTPEPTHTEEPTTAPTETAPPTPEPTQTPETEEPTEPAQPQPDPTTTPINSNKASSNNDVGPSTSPSAHTVQPAADPSLGLQSPDPVAVFADARTLAAASPTMMSPMMATQDLTVETSRPTVAAPAPNPLTAITNLVSSVINFVLNPLAGGAPTSPAQPPLIWSLLAFARKEFENFFTALAGGARQTETPVQQMTSLALAAAINPIPPRPGFPYPNQQLSPSTKFVDWVTGNWLPNNTSQRFSVWGTDVGTMWDNGIPDDPTTPFNEHQVLIAVGDTFSGPNMSGLWRANTIFRSADTLLVDGMAIPNGEWFNGNMFGGAPLSSPTTARQVIFPSGLPAGVTLIPTAGISLPTPGTRFGATQYMSFMSVTQWGAPGSWTTNYSAMAYSTDNGENWTVAPTSVRYNQSWSGNRNFQQSAFVMGNDGYVYAYGTPNGRQGAAYLSRVLPKDILDVTKYDYYSKGTTMTPAGWYRNDPNKATPVFGQETGACGVASAGNTVSEMSVQYNKQLKKYVVLYGDQNNSIVIRTSDTPQGAWSTAKVILPQQNGGIYAPMLHPWSPSTMGTGTDLYWNLSLWSQYNVMLMRTDLTKV
jgi:D-arabinan endo alpha-(1,5)-arabinofuranosidase